MATTCSQVSGLRARSRCRLRSWCKSICALLPSRPVSLGGRACSLRFPQLPAFTGFFASEAEVRSEDGPGHPAPRRREDDDATLADSSLIGVLRIAECRTRNRCLIGRPTLSPVRGHEFAVGTYHRRRS